MCPALHRTLRGSLPRVALLILIASWGCGGGSSSEPKFDPGPTQKLPARITVVTAPKTTAEAGADAGDFVVRVENASGQAVVGHPVQFSQTSGPTGFVFAPYTATTDSSGLARTKVTYRTSAGTDELKATADGLSTPVLVPVTITPGPPFYVVMRPSTVALYGAGDSASFQAWMEDRYTNAIRNVIPDLQVSDTTLLDITPPTTFLGNGMVRARRGGGSAVISSPNAAAQYRIDLGVRVFANKRDACAGVASPQSIGGPVVVTDSVICLAGNPDNVRYYKLVVFNESSDGTASLGSTVTATGSSPAP